MTLPGCHGLVRARRRLVLVRVLLQNLTWKGHDAREVRTGAVRTSDWVICCIENLGAWLTDGTGSRHDFGTGDTGSKLWAGLRREGQDAKGWRELKSLQISLNAT